MIQSQNSNTDRKLNLSYEKAEKAGDLDTGLKEDEKEHLGVDFKNAVDKAQNKPKLGFKLDLSKVNRETD